MQIGGGNLNAWAGVQALLEQASVPHRVTLRSAILEFVQSKSDLRAMLRSTSFTWSPWIRSDAMIQRDSTGIAGRRGRVAGRVPLVWYKKPPSQTRVCMNCH